MLKINHTSSTENPIKIIIIRKNKLDLGILRLSGSHLWGRTSIK